MSVIAIERPAVEPPARLPVDYLSLSSLRQLMMCPEKWRRRYIEGEREPKSGKMLLGSAAGSALAQHFGWQIERGEGLSTEAVLDEFAADWEGRIGGEEVDWGKDTPGELKDSAIKALRDYHTRIAPGIVPISVEREFQLSWPGVEWVVVGYIDLEDAAGNVRDYKMTGKRLTQATADADMQPTMYCTARRAEGNPAPEFAFDAMVRAAKPYAEVVTTRRSDAQLDALTDRIFGLAREIEWRWREDCWSGASPNTWFCGSCRYAGCPLRLAG
jgi:hypothetical protein